MPSPIDNVMISKTKGSSGSSGVLNTGDGKKTENHGTRRNEKSDTDKSKNLLNEIEHVTDWRNHITKTKKFDGTKKEFNFDTGIPVPIIPPDN